MGGYCRDKNGSHAGNARLDLGVDVVLRMERCIGQAGCAGEPNAGRGLCITCYSRHRYYDTLHIFPTMGERTRELVAQGMVPTLPRPASTLVTSDAQRAANERYRQSKYAQRIRVGDVWVHPTAPHGKLTSYNIYGCRGPLCLASQRHYRHTGETVLPCVLARDYTLDDCLDYKSGTL